MLLKISSRGEVIIEKEPLESLGKMEKHVEKWMEKNLDRLIDRIELLPIHVERPAKSEADIIALDSEGNTCIFELKRGKADHKAVGQLFNYWTNIAEMRYDKLQEMALAHLKKEGFKEENFDLSVKHLIHFNLKKKIEKEKFNQESRLFVVAEEANESLWKMIIFLRERFKIPIAFIKFEIYRLLTGRDEELVLHFDTSDANKLWDEITKEEALAEELYQDKERSWWYNTNKAHLDPEHIHDEVFNMGVVATYGPKIYGEKLVDAIRGDHVFAYATGEGIRAYGNVTQKWNGKPVGPKEKALAKDRREYHLPVRWEIVLQKEEAIRPDEIRNLGYNNFRGTFRRIWNSEFAKNLISYMASRRG